MRAMPAELILTAEQESDRRIAKACEAMAKTIIESRDDWMLDRHEFLAVLASVTAYFIAEMAADPMLRDRIGDADGRFAEAFRTVYMANIEAKRLMKIT